MEYTKTTRKSRRLEEQQRVKPIWVSCVIKKIQGSLVKQKVQGTMRLSNRELLDKLSTPKKRVKQRRKLKKIERRLENEQLK